MNLLSPDQKEIIQKEINLRFALAGFFMVIFWISVFLVLEFAIVLYIKIQIPALEERLNREKSTEVSISVEKTEDEIKRLNDSLKMIDIIQNSNEMDLAARLRRIGDIVPFGVRMEKISVSRNSISFTGTADLRSQVLELKDILQEQEFCENIIAPSVPLKEAEVNFSFTCELTKKL